MEVEKGVQRWAIDVSNWNPSSHLFAMLLSLLPPREHSSVIRFVKFGDRKRAIVSRLLQYALVNQVLGIPFDEVVIDRTPEGKPFLVCDNVNLDFPNFNFNVSHHGDYVAIASEPICLVGLDIVSHSVPVNDTVPDFIRSFSSYFSGLEWYRILNTGSSDQMLKTFYRYWCLKEAFVKAMGSGLGYKLDDIEFHHTDWDNIFVKINGKASTDWKFWLLQLGQNHSVAIARAHPKTAVTSYMRTLKRIEFDDNEYNLGLHLPNPSFTFPTVDDLVQLCHCAHKTSRNINIPDEGEIETRSSGVKRTQNAR